MNPISTAPKDRPILLHFPDIVRPDRKLPNGGVITGYTTKGGWIEGFWVKDKDWRTNDDGTEGGYVGGWGVITLPVHGCHCCTSDNQEPDFWMDLPDEAHVTYPTGFIIDKNGDAVREGPEWEAFQKRWSDKLKDAMKKGKSDAV